MKIVVLCGGLSSERHVSLVSGSSICKALRSRGHQAVLVDMFLGLENWEGDLQEVFSAPDGLIGTAAIETSAPDLDAVRAGRKDQSPSLFGKDVLAVCAMADVVFLGLHGACGEDGRVQAAFDLLGIPYTGAGYLGSGMAMDKALTKYAMERCGVPTAPWRDITAYTEADIPQLVEELEVPCAVKIVNGGSSIGVSLPDTNAELVAALRETLHYGSPEDGETKKRGRELTGGGRGERYLPAVEIIPQTGGYFDYVAKYQDGGSLEICPAHIDDALWHEIGEYALRLHKTLGLSVYSRTDFLVDEAGRPWCLEVNTLPGMTPASLLPKEAAAVGLPYEELCDEIVRLSLAARKEERL